MCVKGSYFHEVVFSGKNRDVWLYDTAAVTLDIEETAGNDWARDRRKERALSGSVRGVGFNRQHHKTSNKQNTERFYPEIDSH